MGPMSNLWIHI